MLRVPLHTSYVLIWLTLSSACIILLHWQCCIVHLWCSHDAMSMPLCAVSCPLCKDSREWRFAHERKCLQPLPKVQRVNSVQCHCKECLCSTWCLPSSAASRHCTISLLLCWCRHLQHHVVCDCINGLHGQCPCIVCYWVRGLNSP